MSRKIPLSFKHVYPFGGSFSIDDMVRSVYQGIRAADNDRLIKSYRRNQFKNNCKQKGGRGGQSATHKRFSLYVTIYGFISYRAIYDVCLHKNLS